MSGSDNSLCGRKKGHHVQCRLFRSISDLCPQIIVVYLAVFIIRNDCRQCKVSVCVCVCVCVALGSREAVQNCCGWEPLGEVCRGKGTTTVTATWSQSENKRRSFLLSCGLSISSVFLFYLPTFPLTQSSVCSQPPQSSGLWEESTMTMLPKGSVLYRDAARKPLKWRQCFSGENEIKSKLMPVQVRCTILDAWG